jgi:hypothetical protein
MRKVKEPKPPKPGIRIDGPRRFDRNKTEARRQALAKVADRPKPGDKTAAAKARASEAKRVDRLMKSDGGKDGARVSRVKLRISAMREERAVMRCRPGTFEWQYGRDKQDMLFHAGSHLAILWERAGIAVASSADFLRGTASGYAIGISGARLAAIEKLKAFVVEVGRKVSERLIAYCVSGRTSTEIARMEGVAERDMPAVLRQDLRACAEHFKFLGKRR